MESTDPQKVTCREVMLDERNKVVEDGKGRSMKALSARS